MMDIQRNRIYIKKLLYIITTIILVSCNSPSDKINYGLKKECAKLTADDSCVVNLKGILGFDWDIMYTFPGNSTANEISNTMQVKYNGCDVDEDQLLLVFIKNKKMICKEFVNNTLGRNNFEFGYPNWPNQINKFTSPMFKVYVLNYVQDKKNVFYKLYPAINLYSVPKNKNKIR